MAPRRPLVYQKPILTSSDEPALDTLNNLDLVWRAGEELNPRFARWKYIPRCRLLEVTQLLKDVNW